jgi:hypothetical protein
MRYIFQIDEFLHDKISQASLYFCYGPQKSILRMKGKLTKFGELYPLQHRPETDKKLVNIFFQEKNSFREFY